MDKSRNYGIDLLRICSMYMIVVQHLLLHEGLYSLPFLTPTTANFVTQWFLYVCCYCAVDCFALISGYVGIGREKFTLTPAIILWLRTFFYTFIITVLFVIFKPGTVHKDEWLGAFFPLYTNQYWYISSYFGLLVVMPVLNKGINALDIKRLKAVTLTLIATYSVLPTVLQYDAMNTVAGFSVIWLIVLYIIGAYLKRRGNAKSSPIKCIICYLSLNTISMAVKMILSQFHNRYEFYELAKSNPLISYTSPTLLGASIFLVLAFMQFKIPDKFKKAINILSPLALGIYIIHVNPLIWLNILPLFKKYINASSPYTIVSSVLIIALFIYIVCSMTEFLRHELFKLLKIREKVSSFEEKFTNKLFEII